MSDSSKIKKNYIIFSATDWTENKVSIMHIADILSKENNVFFFQTYGRRLPNIKDLHRILKRFTNRNFNINSNLRIYTIVGIPYTRYSILNKINFHLLNIQFKKKINKSEKYNLIISSPIWFGILNKNQKLFSKITFHCVDNLFTYINHTEFKKDFMGLIKKSDNLVTPNSLINTKLFKNKGIILENGTNFKNKIINQKFKYSCKNIVYSGTLANWVDYDLLNKLIINLKTFNFYILGYIHPLVDRGLLKFLNRSNVFFLGQINYSQLPSIYSSCHIGIIPYQEDNAHIKYSSPTKLHDYIAYNLKIVSTKIPYVEQFKNKYDDLEIANDQDDFCKKIKQYETSKKKSQTISFDNDWNAKKNNILKIF